MRLFTCLCFAVISFNTFAQSLYVTGTVKDAETQKPLAFSSVVLLHGKKGTTADGNGKFKIQIAEQSPSQLIISYLGYQTDTIKTETSKNEYDVFLKPLQTNLNEVFVTGVSKATLIKESPVSVVRVSSKAIEQTNESNIIDVLAKNVPGLNVVKTGANVSKPFVRGLGYNRVLTLYDGVRQEEQQWGDEHGIEADAYNIERAEVIKGPASLMYGSDALAGVVSLMPFVPSEKNGKINGRLVSEYQSNNGLFGNALRIASDNSNWLWSVNGSVRVARNYANKIDGRVYNTGYSEKNASALLGYTANNGYSHLNFTLYDNLQGIPDGSRDSLTRKFTKQVFELPYDDIKDRPAVTNEELNSYKLSPLHQHIQHYRFYNNNYYHVGSGEINTVLAFQQNIRREYNHPTQPSQAGMYVRLNTINYGFNYNAPEFLNIETSFGINGMQQNNKNKDGTDFPIPDYNLFDGGMFIHSKWKYKKITVSGGFRYDVRKIRLKDFYVKQDTSGFNQHVFMPDTLDAVLQFPAFKQTFKGISLSIGATYRLSDYINIKANIARGYRAPNITEIASNGLDPGAHIVYIGNRNFVPEFSLQEDVGVSADFKNLSFSVSVFNNNIQHYIYLAQLTDADGNPVVIVPGNKTFQYMQSSAQLYGAEATFDIHPKAINGFSFNNSLSMIYGYNKKKEFKNIGTSGEYLPLIPPFKLSSVIMQDIKTKSKIITAIHVKGEINYTSEQNRYLTLYNTETPTASYTLCNAAVMTDVKYSGEKIMQLQFQVNNLFDGAYQSNLSRLKYFEYYTQSPNGHLGIYDMGRNICVKMIMPF